MFCVRAVFAISERWLSISTSFLILGPNDGRATMLLAHGAGGAMDFAGLNGSAAALADIGFRVGRFEFDYMAARRVSGVRPPPPRAETLIPEYESAIVDLAATGALIIGGRSMGWRIASIIADDLCSAGKIRGLLCLGYPFHPIEQPDKLRTQHLAALRAPTFAKEPATSWEPETRYPAIRFPRASKSFGSKMAIMAGRRERRSQVSRQPII